MLIRPVLSYTAPVWNNASNSNILKHQRFQNKCLRMMANAPPKDRNLDLHRKYDIPLISTCLFKITKDFYENQMSLEELQEAKPMLEKDMPFTLKVRMPYHILIK